MSSHHVIRDEQEPPIIILTNDFKMELVNELLGWSPVLIVSANVFPIFEAKSIKVDYVIGKGRIENNSYFSTKYIDETDLEDLTYSKVDVLLKGKAYTGVSIFCSQAIKNNLINSLYASQSDLGMPINLFVGDEKTIIIPRSRYVKWYPAGQQLKYDPKSVSTSPTIGDLEDCFIVETAGKYEFLSNDKIVIITEL